MPYIFPPIYLFRLRSSKITRGNISIPTLQWIHDWWLLQPLILLIWCNICPSMTNDNSKNNNYFKWPKLFFFCFLYFIFINQFISTSIKFQQFKRWKMSIGSFQKQEDVLLSGSAIPNFFIYLFRKRSFIFRFLLNLKTIILSTHKYIK